jgi:hypothetical protein
MKQSALISRLPRQAFTSETTPGAGYCPTLPLRTVWQRFCAIAFAVLFIGSLNSAVGASWYVDNAASGANNGTSWASAWTSFSSIVWGSSGVKAGDTLYISGGSSSQTYSSGLSVGASGTSSSRITIAVGQDAGHNGMVILSGVRLTCPQSYVTIDGSVNGASHLTVSGVSDLSNKDIGAAVSGNGNGLRFRYLTISLCNNCIDISGASTVEIDYNNFSHYLGDHAVRATVSGSSFDNGFIHNNTFTFCGAYPGPDGIQTVSGMSIYSNKFECVAGTDAMPSGQHPDFLQITGNYLKIYDNEFINDGDSQIDYDCYANSNPHDVWIYNNIFRLNQNNKDNTAPDFIRVYNSYGTGTATFNNWKICNNTFVDNPNNAYGAVNIGGYGGLGSPTGSGNEIRNNIWYNCSSGNHALTMTLSGWLTDNNVFYYSGSSAQPKFVSYTAYSDSSDYHLLSSDTVARNTGLNLSSYFTLDKDGKTRPAASAWDLGAYQYSSSSGGNTNPLISVSPASLDFGSITVGASNRLTFTVRNAGGGTLAGTASVSGLFSIVSGGTYSLGSNQSQIVTVQYTPTVAGSYVQSVSFTGGGGASAQVTGTCVAAPPVGANVFSFEAEAGILTAPLTISGTYISQAVEVTSPLLGGRSAYDFVITNGGDYVVQALLNAPSDAANSLWFNIDSEPQDPGMIWDVPVTTGFQQQTASWRGTGTFDNDQYVPKTFTLAAGAHELIIRGREANVQIDKIWIFKVPPAPRNLRVLSGP